MKLKISNLKKIIREEQMRGVPQFAVYEASRKFIDELRQHIQRHVQVTRGSETESRDVLEKAEETFLELEKEINKIAEENLWRLLQRL